MPYPKYPLIEKQKKASINLDENDDLKNINKNQHRPFSEGMDLKTFFNNFPEGSDTGTFLRETADRTRFSRKLGKPILFLLDDSFIKLNMSSLIIDLMERGWISALSVPLSFALMDFEISLSGNYIDYSEAMFEGKIKAGVAEETGLFFNFALKDKNKDVSAGVGEALGSYLGQSNFTFRKNSILYAAFKLNIPVVVSSTNGTEPIFFHSDFDGSLFGGLLEKDFILFSSIISGMNKGGTILAFNSDIRRISMVMNAIMFSKVSKCNLKEITFSIFNKFCAERLNQYLKIIEYKKRYSIHDYKGRNRLAVSTFLSYY